MTNLPGSQGYGNLNLVHVLHDVHAIFRRHISVFMLIIFLSRLPSIMAFETGHDGILPVPTHLYQILGYFAVQIALWLPEILAAAIVIIIGLMQLNHRRPSYSFAIHRTQRRSIIICMGSTLEVGTLMLMTFIFMLPEIYEFDRPHNSFTTAGIGVAVCAVPVCALLVLFSVYLPIATFEERGIWQSLRRSWELTTGNRWKVLLITGVVAAVHAIVFWFPRLPLTAIHPTAAFCLKHALVLLVICFRSAIQTALYHNLRRITGEPITSLEFS